MNKTIIEIGRLISSDKFFGNDDFKLTTFYTEENVGEKEDFFEGLYNNSNMKLIIVLTYCLIVVVLIGLGFVLWFERSGQAGHYRTLVNQLSSFNLDQVCKCWKFMLEGWWKIGMLTSQIFEFEQKIFERLWVKPFSSGQFFEHTQAMFERAMAH